MKIEEYAIGRCKIEIHQDEDASSPREDDNLGTIAHWHRSYDFGDKIDADPTEFLKDLARKHVHFKYPDSLFEKNWEKILEAHYVVLPVSLLDHSGLHIWVGSGSHWSDSAGWDSGQVGFIYCSLEKALENNALKKGTWKTRTETRDVKPMVIDEVGKTITPTVVGPPRKISLREHTKMALGFEVEAYGRYLQGECYGFVLETEDGKEDSCWNFDGLDYMKSEVYDIAVCHNERMDEADRIEVITENERQMAEVFP